MPDRGPAPDAGWLKEEMTRSAKRVLERAGYVVLKKKSYQAAQERHRISRRMEEVAVERVESVEHWARTTLHNEIRELQARCTFLYGAARAHGATADELAQGYWPTTGVNCPNGARCEPIQMQVGDA